MESTKAYSQCRPVRVAYLVNEEMQNSAALLDAVFAECMGRWSGRFTLIVPASASGPTASFLPWLKEFDPDIIYSYVPLTEHAVLQLHEIIYPSFLTQHQSGAERSVDEYFYQPNLPIRPLAVDTVIPLAAVPKFGGGRNIKVIESLGRLSVDRLVRDSFGVFIRSTGRSFGLPFSEFGEALYLVADDESQPRERYGMRGADTVNSIPALINSIASRPLLTMSQMSSMAAPRLSLRSGKDPAFNLVVGDSFLDRVYYWNARSSLPTFLDGSMVDLRLPEAALDDEYILSAVTKLIRERNRVTDGFSNSAPRVTIRSSTVPLDALRVLENKLRGGNSWINCSVEKIDSIDDCLPINADLDYSRYSVSRFHSRRSIGAWHEDSIEDDQLQLTPPAPEHLKYCPAGMVSGYSGVWAVDVDIERQNNHSRYDNVRHHWVFPRRLRMLSSVLRGYALEGNRGIAIPRVEQRGLLTLYTDTVTKVPVIALPADRSAIHTALVAGRNWWPFERIVNDQGQMPEQLLAEATTSSSGRYFLGILGLFGDLNFASSVLLHSLWRGIFEALGTAGTTGVAREEVVKSRLRKRVQSLTPGSERDIQKLASIVMEEAEHFRGHVPILSWIDLDEMFTAFQTDILAKEPRGLSTAEQIEWWRCGRRRFRETVQFLCSRDILHQGYQHRCEKCLHRSWIPLGDLERELICEVCEHSELAPVDRPWDFRLNEFLREGIRQQGVLPLFWTLSKLRSMQEDGLLFEGPLNVYLDKGSRESGKPSTDVDLTIISSGVVHMCEVKQSGRQLNNQELINFSDLMKRLRPDVAVVAVMEPENDSTRDAKTLLEKNLSDSGIEVRVLTLGEEDLDSIF